MKKKEYKNKDFDSFYFEYFLPGDNETGNRVNQDTLTKTSTVNQNIAAAPERPITLLLTKALFKGQTNGEVRAVIKNKIIKYFIHRYFSLLLPVIFFFLVQMSIDVPFLYARGLESADQYGDVNIYFQFDPRFKARPFKVFLKKDEERHKDLEKIDPNRVQYYEVGKLAYDFQNIKTGKYWVGFSFKYLRKNRFMGKPVIEIEFMSTWISTETNLIEVKNDKKVCVDLIIKLSLAQRPEPYGEEDPEGEQQFIIRSKPKSSDEELILDENYFPFFGAGVFSEVKRMSSNNIDYSKMIFDIVVYDDYPFLHFEFY